MQTNGSERIKICHLTSAHADGDIRIFHKECVSLAEAGNDVHLVVPNSKSRTEKGVAIHSFSFTPGNRISRFISTTRKTYKLALEIDADVYHFHDPELLPYGLKLKRKGKQVIYDAHEDVPRQILGKHWIPGLIRPLISTLFEKYENYVAKRLSYIVVSTPTIRKRFEKINRNCTDICNYPILEENVDPAPWENRKNEICYIGGITQIRGVKELVESLKYNPETRLNLAGNYSPESFREELANTEGWKQVKEFGYVGRKEIVQILNQSKIGMVTLYPQKNYLDSLPIKLYEYMLSGIPVVASDFPLWKQIISDSDCGICIDPKNPKEIADAIAFLLENDQRAKEMGNNGRKAVLEKYNWSIEKEKLINIYHSLMK